MNEQDVRIKELLDLDAQNPGFRARYQKDLGTHLGNTLPKFRKTRYVVVGLAGLIGCLVCGSLSLTEPASTPNAVRGLLALFAIFGLGWTLFAGWALARGRGGYAAERALAAKMAFGFTLASVMALSLVSSLSGKETAGMPLVATGLALLILASVLLTNARIDQAELAIREQILRLECRLLDRTKANSGPRVD